MIIIMRKCRMCGKQFNARAKNSNIRKFCSPSCSSKYRSGKNSHFYVSGLEKRVCVACGKEFMICPSSDQRFCSKQCWYKSPNKPYNKKIKSRKIKPINNPRSDEILDEILVGVSPFRHKQLLEEYNNLS